MYGQHLEANLQALHRKLHKLSYRPRPVRRVEIPYADGGTRTLGSSALADKIVPELARRILETI
jgi:retron-type reverse transcriptase